MKSAHCSLKLKILLHSLEEFQANLGRIAKDTYSLSQHSSSIAFLLRQHMPRQQEMDLTVINKDAKVTYYRDESCSRGINSTSPRHLVSSNFLNFKLLIIMFRFVVI
jgi:hypothetical protein